MRKRAILSNVRSEEPAGPDREEAEDRPAGPSRKGPGSGDERKRMHEDVRDVDFPIAMRGYDRAAVDGYVKRVNKLIAELEISASPEAAIKHALEQVSEETRGILERAHESADAFARRSRAAADDRLAEAEREAVEVRGAADNEARELRETTQGAAKELRESAERESQELRATVRREVEELRGEAEARVERLDRHAEAVWQERRRLIDDMRTIAQQLLETADKAGARFPPVAEAAARSELPPGADSPPDQRLLATEKQPGAEGDSPPQPR